MQLLLQEALTAWNLILCIKPHQFKSYESFRNRLQRQK